MRVLAVLFRLFALIGLLGLAGLLWLKFDTQTKQQVAFMDEVIDDAYTVLQSEKDNRIKLKKSLVSKIFINKADRLNRKMFTIKRPGTGLLLMPMNRYLTEMKICCLSQSKHWTHQSRAFTEIKITEIV